VEQQRTTSRTQINNTVYAPVHVDRAQGGILLLLDLLLRLGQNSVVVLRIGNFWPKLPQVCSVFSAIIWAMRRVFPDQE
jgi:hypothetical protein